ncbi:bacterial Ig-like domain-containing protein, partial [Faecalimonas umbilicata]|nr:bacterial Ig-like domain-containing protein [Faecalimonas umbilicata]
CTVTGFDNTKAGTQKITVTYEEQTVTFEVTVKEPSVTSITVKTAPEKTEYKIGEELDLTGIVIEAAYDDGTKKEIDIKDCTVTGFDNTKAGTQKITVTYEEQTVTFEVTVKEPSVTSITVKTAPEKTEYKIGEELD